MTMITPSYLGETIEYSSLHACRSTLEDPTASGAAVQAVRERRAGTMTASTSTGPRVSKADRLLALAKHHHERRDATRWPYLSCDGRMAACRPSAEHVSNNVKSEIQGPHTEALQCAGYYGSRALALRDRLAAPRRCSVRRGDPLSACPIARGEPVRGGGCRAWAPTDQ